MKTHQQIKSLDQLERTRRKRRRKGEVAEKFKVIVKFVVLDVYQIFPVPYNSYL